MLTKTTKLTNDELLKHRRVVESDSDEWHLMWEKLGRKWFNRFLKEPTVACNFGEMWQYMNSWVVGSKIHHEFRHRLHPITRTRCYVTIEASRKFTNENA